MNDEPLLSFPRSHHHARAHLLQRRWPARRFRRTTALVGAALATIAGACSDSQRFGDEPRRGEPAPSPSTPATATSPDGGDGPPFVPPPVTNRRWAWLNPRPTGEKLLAIGGSSDENIWLVGARGTVLKWDGKNLSVPYEGPEDTTFHAVWTSGPDDVWLFGDTSQGARLLRWNGATWSEQLGLAGKRVLTVSSGSTKRLLVVTEAQTISTTWEYDRSAGAWVELSEGPIVTGIATDAWVAPSGDAWIARRSSRFFLRCRPGKPECDRVLVSLAGPIDAFGIWGSADDDIHAFYTEPTEKNVRRLGSLHFDGLAWGLRDDVDDSLGGFDAVVMNDQHSPAAGTVDGQRMALLGDVVVTYRPEAVRTPEFPYAYTTRDSEPLYPDVFSSPSTTALWTAPSGATYAIGELGLFARFDPKAMQWAEVLPSVRERVGVVNGAPDGGRLSFTRTSVLRWSDSQWRSSFLGEYEDIFGVRAFSSNEAYVASSRGIGRWTTSSGLPVLSRLSGGSFVQALWGDDNDGTWAATLAKPPDLSYADWKTTKGSACFGAKAAPGKLPSWECRETAHRIFSISGTSASDVWFAGDELLHWDGAKLEASSAFAPAERQFAGVHARGKDDVWLWGQKSFHFDGTRAVPLAEALGTTIDVGDGNVLSLVSDTWGDVYVLVGVDTPRNPTYDGPSAALIYRFARQDGTFTLDRAVNAPLRTLSVHGDEIWATGERGVTLRLSAVSSPR